jgi:hypothetical protein
MFFNEIGGAFVTGNPLLLLGILTDFIKTWKLNHGVNTQILALRPSKLQ